MNTYSKFSSTIAAICAVVAILILKCCRSRLRPFKVTWCHRSREHSTCTMWFSTIMCSTDTDPLSWPVFEPQIRYPGRDPDLKGYVTLLVTWQHGSIYSISFRCFIGTDTNLKFVDLTIFELLAICAQKFRDHVTPTMLPFRKLLGVMLGLSQGMHVKW